MSIPLKHRKAIEDYEQIMRKLGFARQHCTFHLIKNMTTNLKPKITEELEKYETELRKNNTEISESKIKKKIRKTKKKKYLTK